MRYLFLALCLGLLVIAYAAATNGQPVIGIGAAVIGLWLGASALPRRRR